MKRPILRRVMFLGFLGLRALGWLLPLGAVRSLGASLGSLAYLVLGGQRRLVDQHLVQAFGDQLIPAERRRIARGVFRNLGQTMMEWLVLPKLSLSALQRLITCEGLEHLREALAEGHGVIALTGHFGNWEMIPLYIPSLGFPGDVLARPLRYPEYASFLSGLRAKHGVATIERGSFKDVAKSLKANRIIGVLPDQDMDSLEGIFVNFFGHPAHTPVGPAALSLMTGAPIVPLFLIREGTRFRLVIEPPIRAPQQMDRTEAMQALTQAWSDVVESYIRRYPDQWVWMHRRWKTQPSMQPAHGSPARPVGPGRARFKAQGGSLKPSLSVALFALCWLFAAMVTGCAKHKKPAPPPPQSQVTQQMNDFTLTGYGKNGVTTWKLNGQGAVLEGQIVTVQHPDAIGFQPGRTAYVTASIAQINQENRHIRMEHDVTMHTSDGMWLASPIMYWMPDQNQVATDQAVRIESDHMLLHGRGLNALTQLKEATLLRDIEMVLNPSDHEKALPGLSAGGARGETRKQVTITCDGPLAFDYEHNIATFEHNVHVNDPSGDLYSDKLIAYINQDTHTIRYAEAIGRVRILQPNRNTATSERAVYEPAIGKITLVGKPGLVLYPKNDQAGPQSSFGGFLEVPMSVGSAPEEPPQKQLELGGETTLQVGKTVPEEAAAAEADDTQEEAEPAESGSHHGTSVY